MLDATYDALVWLQTHDPSLPPGAPPVRFEHNTVSSSESHRVRSARGFVPLDSDGRDARSKKEAELTPTVADDADQDWTIPGVYRVAPNVYRIPMPLPEEIRLRAVNAYALVDDSGVVFVDSGASMPGARKQLEACLRAIGAELGDVRRFLITHQHHDHYTLAVEVRRDLGIPISAGIGERRGLALVGTPGRQRLKAQTDALRRHGAGELADVIAARVAGSDTSRFWELPDSWLHADQEVAMGERVLRVAATPGHTHGHVILVDPDAQLMFTGDHVLPQITPSIGFEPVAFPHPLLDYLASLRLVRDLPEARMLPAHGPVQQQVHPRVDALVSHHERRLDAAEAVVRGGAHTAYQVAQGLRWTRRERALGELDNQNKMLAILEAAAHLDVLVSMGRIGCVTEGAHVRYMAAPPAKPVRGEGAAGPIDP
jgi:glyoxylase-like metal-dependent hydrolase (beta-lactamase superfamily II)